MPSPRAWYEASVMRPLFALICTFCVVVACGKDRSSLSAAADYPAESLGALRFEVAGGTPKARQHFERGLLALHSFWYDEAKKQFEAAIAADASFSMAYWGLAMSSAKLLWNQDDLQVGRDALARMPSPNLLPVKEQAWVVAALSLFRRAKADVRASRQEFLATMESIHAKFPDDESATFLALALLSTLRPGAPDEHAIRSRAGALASDVLARNPKHPGAAHYLIHAYDTPELASQALDAAKLYATIAPAAFHARHMPAHIFARLGRWQEAQTSCEDAWQVSVAWARREKLPVEAHDYHSLAWLVEIPFERGRPSDAKAALARYADAVRAGLSGEKRAAYANTVSSYMVRTGDAKRLDELLAPLTAPATAPSVVTGSMGCGYPALIAGAPELLEQRAVLAARARAAAMQQDVAGVTKHLDERDAVDAKLRRFLEMTQPADLIATVDRLRPFVREALLARARRDDAALIKALEPLAIDQQADFFGEGMPTGELQLEEIAAAWARLGDATRALETYRRVLAQHPGRATALLGAARAATKVGASAEARDLYRRLAVQWNAAEANVDGVSEARAATVSSHQ